ncbi:MAG: hypothetical protein N2C14_15200 [Planctomycetales bacterium]
MPDRGLGMSEATPAKRPRFQYSITLPLAITLTVAITLAIFRSGTVAGALAAVAFGLVGMLLFLSHGALLPGVCLGSLLGTVCALAWTAGRLPLGDGPALGLSLYCALSVLLLIQFRMNGSKAALFAMYTAHGLAALIAASPAWQGLQHQLASSEIYVLILLPALGAVVGSCGQCVVKEQWAHVVPAFVVAMFLSFAWAWLVAADAQPVAPASWASVSNQPIH